VISDEVIKRFRTTGALLDGHFILSSGLHSKNYLQCALVLQHPQEAEHFGQLIADNFREFDVQLVASPAIGGIIIGHEVARALNARFVWTERVDGVMTLRRGFTVMPGERTLIVEDVITTGGSTRETIEALRKSGADVLGAGSIIDRSAGTAEVGVPMFALATLDVPVVAAEVCELCRKGIPAVKPGSKKVS
jgi:orotate phosphoribosyltransferase